MLQRADGARYKTGTGHRGTYEWVVKDGLWAAYYYPGGVQTHRTRVELMPPQVSGGKAYDACVEHNKKLLGITGGESGPVTMGRKSTTAVCPECHEAHKGECM
jgi:hypothetical protein